MLQPYKFWTLNKEEHNQLNNIISTSDVQLNSFTKLGTLPEWVLKRCLLLDCDLLNNLIAYFDVDPAVGAPLMETIVYSAFPDKYVYNDFKNVKITLVENQFNKLRDEVLRYPDQDKIRDITGTLATFSFSIGSNPSEVFNHFAKTYKHSDYQIISKVAQLFGYAKYLKKEFPIQIVGKTDPQNIQFTYYQMENLRLMYMKIQQIDYFIWMTRIQKIAKESQDTRSQHESQ